MSARRPDFEVLIVGSGLMGAAVAREIREGDAEARILMIDAGAPIGSVPGQHLHDVPDRSMSDGFNERVRSGIQGIYTGAATATDIGATMVEAEPGMYHLTTIGEDSSQLPAAAVAWNAGGMGIHWTAATPFPWGDEVPDFIPGPEWKADLGRAAQLLRVNEQPFPTSPPGAAVVAALKTLFESVHAPGRDLRQMPMAVQPDEHGMRRRTGPNTIFAPIGDSDLDPDFTFMPGLQAMRLLHDDGVVRGAELRRIATGGSVEVEAASTIVCADAIRSPQLLFASGIRPAALGRYLNEHAFLSSRVITDPIRLRFDPADVVPEEPGEVMTEHLWLPHSGSRQPFHWQIVGGTQPAGRGLLAYSVGLGVYVPTQIRADNRLEFSETATDAAGMPRITVHFSYTREDEELIERGRQMQRQAAEALGPFDPETEAALLPPGSSLHFTGTVRMGPTDDGTSVCDTSCRVWGFDNLYVASNGVIPTALRCNSTLTGMTSAVRASRSVLGKLRAA
jgi:choline dehydrogenase-like flavoprotein